MFDDSSRTGNPEYSLEVLCVYQQQKLTAAVNSNVSQFILSVSFTFAVIDLIFKMGAEQDSYFVKWWCSFDNHPENLRNTVTTSIISCFNHHIFGVDPTLGTFCNGNTYNNYDTDHEKHATLSYRILCRQRFPCRCSSQTILPAKVTLASRMTRQSIPSVHLACHMTSLNILTWQSQNYCTPKFQLFVQFSI